MTSLELSERRARERRGDEPLDDTRFRLTPSFVVQVCAWLVAALMTYSAMSARVAVVETKESGTEQRMERIENKLDRVLERLK